MPSRPTPPRGGKPGRAMRRIKPTTGSTRSVPSRDVTADAAGQPKPAVRRRRPAGDSGEPEVLAGNNSEPGGPAASGADVPLTGAR